VNKYLRLIIYSAVGGAIGFAYYYFVGCSNGGSCPLTSRWYITTIYGFIAGVLMALPNKTARKTEQESNE